MRRSRRWAIWMAGGWAALGLLEAASADPTEAGVFTLGEIRVSAPVSDVEPASSTVTAEDMDRFDRRTVGTAIDMLPGVNAGKTGARNEATSYVRGFDLRQTPVLIDGIPVYVPYDGYVDLARFTTFDLSKIQVSKGWASVLDGPNALGGIINLVSRRPERRYEGYAETGLRLNRDGGFDGYDTAVGLGTRQESWWAQASGSWLDFDHFRLPGGFDEANAENGGLRDNSDAEDWKVNVKLALTPREKDEYSLNYIQQNAEKGTPPYAGLDPRVTPRFWRWPSWDKRSIYWISNTSFAHGLSLKTRAYYDTFENTVHAYDDDGYDTQNKRSSFRSYYDDYSYGGSTEAGWQIAERHELRAAFHYKHDVHREHNRGEPERTLSDDTYSSGLQYTWRVTDAFDLVGGAGYDFRNPVDAEDFQRNVISDLPTADSDAFNAQAAAIYHLGGDGDVHFMVSRKSRFPTLKERYSYRMGTAIPNPDLDSETGLLFELGASEQFWGHTRFEAAIFYADLTDAIQDVRLTPNLNQTQNVGDAVHQGFELGARSLVIPWAELGVAYTFLHRENETDDDIELTGTPEHSLFAYADFSIVKPLHLVPSLQFASSRHLTSDGERDHGFVLADIALRWEANERLGFEISARNLFDANFELSEGYPEQGRNYGARMRARF